MLSVFLQKKSLMIGNEPAADGGVAKAAGIDFLIVKDFKFPAGY